MCDSPNTTDIVETECYLCPTQELCNEFRHSYVNRCKWKVILGRQNEDGDMDGICTDGLDYIAAGFSPGVATIGWLIFLFGIGWLRKDRGKFALLRRHGFEVTADVVERRSDRTVIPTADGLPDLEVERFWATVRWKPLPPPQATWKGMCKAMLSTGCRRGAVDHWFRRHCSFWCCCSRRRRISSHGLKPWQRLMDEDGAVKVDVQVAEELWETYTDPAKDTLRIKYDPFDDRNWVLPAAAVGPGISKLMTVAITILGGLSLVAMGTIMIADAFHCGPDFWGFPSCCNVCHDWADVGDSTADSWDRKQQCYRGACDGVGGKSHWYWCANEHGGTPQQCYIGWAMVPIPVATAALALGVAAVLLKNNGICRVGSSWDRASGFIFGEGRFCCPDQPPRLNRRDHEEPETQKLLDFAGASGHL